MTVIVVILGFVVLIVVASVVGARRGTPMAFEPDDVDVERGRGVQANYDDGLAPTDGPTST